MKNSCIQESIGRWANSRQARSLAVGAAVLLAAGMQMTVPVLAQDPLRQPDLAPVVAQATPVHEPVELVRDGRPVAVVYVAPPVAKYQRDRAFEVLLRELVEVIELSTGAKLPVVAEMPGPEQSAIVIGDCAASRAAGLAALVRRDAQGRLVTKETVQP